MPCVTLPFTKGPTGLPVGIQLVGRQHEDAASARHRRLGDGSAVMKPLSATEAVAAIEAGTLTSEKLVRGCLDRIAERDDAVKAWVLPRSRPWRSRRPRPPTRPSGGVLRGIPVGVKDIIDTHDMPTGHNSPIFEGKVPFGDAACVALCRTANAVIMGKTVTTEFANRHPGADDQSAQSRAHAGRLVVGLGRGGGRRPRAARLRHADRRLGDPARPPIAASIGYKPTFGDFSRVGIKMQCHSVDTLGLMARTLDDIALFRGAVLKLPPVQIDRDIGRAAHRLLPLAGLGRGRARHQGAARRDRDQAFATRARRWSTSPSRAAFADIIDDHAAITGWESVRNYADERLRNPDKVSAELMDGPMKRGLAVTFERYVAAQRKAVAFKAHVDSLFDKVDLLLTPERAGRGARRASTSPAIRVFNSIWTLAGTPCVTLPAGTGAKGLPLGIQLVGLRHDDDRAAFPAAWVAAHLELRSSMPKINGERLLGDLRRIADFGRYETGVHRPHLSPQDVESRHWLAGAHEGSGPRAGDRRHRHGDRHAARRPARAS